MLDTLQPVSLRPALLVEDDPATQRRLRQVLVSLGCPEEDVDLARGITHAHERVLQRRYGLVLVDIGLPDGSGIDLIAWLHERQPQAAMVVVSGWQTEEVIVAALQAGAVGYLLKERDDLELGLALRSIERGGAPIDPFIARRILAMLSQPAPAASRDPAPARQNEAPPALSPREREILRLVAQGLSNREMAERLAISRLTVECHTKNIYRKLVVGSRTEAVFQARRHGLLS